MVWNIFQDSVYYNATFFLAILKNSSYDGGLSVCIFVALSVRMCVEGANKVEGTMSNYK